MKCIAYHLIRNLIKVANLIIIIDYWPYIHYFNCFYYSNEIVQNCCCFSFIVDLDFSFNRPNFAHLYYYYFVIIFYYYMNWVCKSLIPNYYTYENGYRFIDMVSIMKRNTFFRFLHYYYRVDLCFLQFLGLLNGLHCHY